MSEAQYLREIMRLFSDPAAGHGTPILWRGQHGREQLALRLCQLRPEAHLYNKKAFSGWIHGHARASNRVLQEFLI
jgi:hypothetical protein